ncbi:hypothetical protein FSHL1_007042 [Fusarium sambucinum]
MHVGQVTEGLNAGYVPGLTMMMNGARIPEEYGKVLHWGHMSPQELMVYTGLQFFAGEGLLVLKAQVRILDFLVEFCRELLHEIPSEDLMSGAYPLQKEPSLKNGIDESKYSSALEALNIAESQPSVPETQIALSIFEAEISKMEDKIFSTRERLMTSLEASMEESGQSAADLKAAKAALDVEIGREIRNFLAPLKEKLSEARKRNPTTDPVSSLKSGIDESGYSSMASCFPTRGTMSATEDHIWSLREDPEYFRVELLEKKDHSYESVKTEDGKQHPLNHKVNEDKLWGTMVSRIAAESYERLEHMAQLHRQARDLSVLREKYKDEIQPNKELPDEYRNALYYFRFCLQKATNHAIKAFEVEFQASPPMRKFYVRTISPTGEDECYPNDHKRSTYTDVENSLLFIKTILCMGEEQWARQYTLIDELERLLKATPEADRLISAQVYKTLSYISVLSQCTKRIDLYQPWSRFYHYQKDHGLYADGVTIDFTPQHHMAFKSMRDMVQGIRGRQIPLQTLGRAADPAGGKFKYPYEKRRTKDTVNALRQAEANLDAVWAEVDKLTNITKFKDLALYRLLSQPRSLQRTAPWVEPEKTQNKGQPRMNEDLMFFNRPLSNLFLGESEQPKIDKTTKKTKTKTKGEPSKPTFEVDARALKVFRTLFFNPEVTSTPGEIPWNDFLHAMGSTGFQIGKLYGSVWQFQPTNLDVERGIHFHEPHPKGKIDFKIARRQGRRLARTYGWHSGMFALKKK